MNNLELGNFTAHLTAPINSTASPPHVPKFSTVVNKTLDVASQLMKNKFAYADHVLDRHVLPIQKDEIHKMENNHMNFVMISSLCIVGFMVFASLSYYSKCKIQFVKEFDVDLT